MLRKLRNSPHNLHISESSLKYIGPNRGDGQFSLRWQSIIGSLNDTEDGITASC
ncbi:hypothetical protein OAK48_04675 [Deltaproteobacteria bacterium]|nr:hypothetical protein [Deltaproteobacteria bacterium]